MSTDVRAERREGGFTLIEVLIAMMILAVGLLGLEALGIGVARGVGRAERRSAQAVVAADTMERMVSRIREGHTISSHSGELGESAPKIIQGDLLRVTATPSPTPSPTPVGGTPTGNRNAEIRVTIIPSTSSRIPQADSFTMVRNVFVP